LPVRAAPAYKPALPVRAAPAYKPALPVRAAPAYAGRTGLRGPHRPTRPGCSS